MGGGSLATSSARPPHQLAGPLHPVLGAWASRFNMWARLSNPWGQMVFRLMFRLANSPLIPVALHVLEQARQTTSRKVFSVHFLA